MPAQSGRRGMPSNYVAQRQQAQAATLQALDPMPEHVRWAIEEAMVTSDLEVARNVCFYFTLYLRTTNSRNHIHRVLAFSMFDLRPRSRSSSCARIGLLLPILTSCPLQRANGTGGGLVGRSRQTMDLSFPTFLKRKVRRYAAARIGHRGSFLLSSLFISATMFGSTLRLVGIGTTRSEGLTHCTLTTGSLVACERLLQSLMNSVGSG